MNDYASCQRLGSPFMNSVCSQIQSSPVFSNVHPTSQFQILGVSCCAPIPLISRTVHGDITTAFGRQIERSPKDRYKAYLPGRSKVVRVQPPGHIVKRL